jgi:phospholipid/cholesterol/gamma-HCH transport system substrate-binding protein
MFEKPELKVGLLFLVSFALVGFMSMKVAKGVGVFTAETKHPMVVDDASGIIENTAVKVAGVKVGVVEKIELKGGKAVLTLSIRKGLGLSKSAYAEFKSDGILGSKHIALGDEGATAEKLKSGDPLAAVASVDSMGDVLAEVGKVAKSLNEVALAIKDATINGTTDTPIGRIMNNIETLTADLAEVSSVNKGRINDIIARLDGISGTLDSVLGEGSKQRVNEAFDNAYSGLAKFDESLENVRSITEKIDSGEGTVGRLINDEETIDGINEVVSNLNNLLGGASRLRTSFDYHSEYLTSEGDVISFIGIKLQPGADRYYELALTQDPFGVDTTKTITRTGTENDDFEEVITDEDKIRITALFAKNFYNFTLKGGLIQSTGGFGVDYTAMNRKLRLSAEVFDFSEDANVRMFARYNVYNGLYFIGGYNSILSDNEAISSPFFGAGLYLNNDDLATLASFALRR